jgi:hypothetical protein
MDLDEQGYLNGSLTHAKSQLGPMVVLKDGGVG